MGVAFSLKRPSRKQLGTRRNTSGCRFFKTQKLGFFVGGRGICETASNEIKASASLGRLGNGRAFGVAGVTNWAIIDGTPILLRMFCYGLGMFS